MDELTIDSFGGHGRFDSVFNRGEMNPIRHQGGRQPDRAFIERPASLVELSTQQGKAFRMPSTCRIMTERVDLIV